MNKMSEDYKLGRVRMSKGSKSKGFYITGLQQGEKEKSLFASSSIVNRSDFYDGQLVQYMVNEIESENDEDPWFLVEQVEPVVDN